MRRLIFMMFLLLSATSLVACSDDNGAESSNDVRDKSDTAGENEDTSFGADAGMDASDGNKDGSTEADAELDGSGEDEPDVCQPTITECPANQCGEIDNGCGTMIVCEPCPCEAGVAIEAQCGVCGLGKQNCGADETGFGSCSAPQIPDIAADADEHTCESKLIFVDAGASGNGDGSKAAPFSSYATAIAAANEGQTIILGGSTPYAEGLEIKNGVSVVGGFSATPEFIWNPAKAANFDVEAGNNDVFGLQARDIHKKTVVAQIELNTADATLGMNNYGAHVIDSDELTLDSVKVTAGKGGKGDRGTDGEPGASGSNGRDGADGGWDYDYNDAQGAYKQFGAKGGNNDECEVANGGDGGDAGAKPSSGTSVPAAAGESTTGANGGSAGFLTPGREKGGRGDDGAGATSAGDNGSGGENIGQVVADYWDASRGVGAAGQRGEHGHGGGGGGGSIYDDSYARATGSAGAGGGAGGCGGKGGEGGEPGGASFGLLLVRSDIELVNSEFRASLGGVGGQGGNGGLGGRGGNGGRGSNIGMTPGQGYWEPYNLAWQSGDGGNGSNGRDGGAGGGGAGGASYGVYCSQSRIETDDTTSFLAGGSARGGSSAGNDGVDGASKDSEGCN